jgi:hypothetical protein
VGRRNDRKRDRRSRCGGALLQGVFATEDLAPGKVGAITYAADQLAAEVIRSHRLPTPLVWIEHWPRESTDGGEEAFKLVVFSSYKVKERAPYLGETRAWIEDATWKRLDRATVEALVGGTV